MIVIHIGVVLKHILFYPLSAALCAKPLPADSFLPERDYVTFGSLLSQFRLSSVCNVGAPYSGVEAFGTISSPLCTLAIL